MWPWILSSVLFLFMVVRWPLLVCDILPLTKSTNTKPSREASEKLFFCNSGLRSAAVTYFSTQHTPFTRCMFTLHSFA